MTIKAQDILISLGLSSAEATIYLTLLNTGPNSIRGIAAESAINRGMVYDSLKNLIKQGLVSFNQKGERRKYCAENPEKIRDLISEKQIKMEKLHKDAEELIPNLSVLAQHREGSPVVKFYEDDEGIVTILKDVLGTVSKLPKKEYCVYSARPVRQYIYRRFPNFTRQRIKAGIFVKALAVGEGGEQSELFERKWLKEPTGEQLSSYVIIYGPKVAVISISPDDTPYGVIIEEPGVAAMQKYLFQKLWESES